MKYAITGHKGLIGKELKERLDSAGHTCELAVDKRDYNKENIIDMEDWKVKGVDIFFQLAAHCKINQAIKNPALPFENNVLGIYSVLEFCRRNKIPKIVFFSSSRVLSKENNPYTVSKLYGEELCKAYKACYGIDYIIIRPSTVYSPGKDETHRLMDIWINNAKKGKYLEIYGDKHKSLSFTYVEDFVDGVMRFIKVWNENYNKEYNIAGNEELLVDVAKEIKRQTKSKSKIVFKSPETEQPQIVHLQSDFKCLTTIKEGIRKCLLE